MVLQDNPDNGWPNSKLRAIFLAAGCFILTLALIGFLKNNLAVGRYSRLSGQYRKLSSVSTKTLDFSQEHLLEAPTLSRDGGRVLFNVLVPSPESGPPGHKGSANKLILWEEGTGALTLWTSLNMSARSVTLSADGRKIAFLSGKSEEGQNNATLQNAVINLWEDGFGVTPLIKAKFRGSWWLRFSGNGAKLLVVPKDDQAEVTGEVKNQVIRKGDSLLFSFDTRNPDGHLRNKIPSAKPVFRIDTLRGLARAQALSFEENHLRTISSSPLQIHRTSLANAASAYDIDGIGGADLLTFAALPGTPIWRAYLLSGYSSAVDNTSNVSAVFYTWRLGDNAGIPVPGDYNGDGIIDLATFSPGKISDWNSLRSNWRIYLSEPETHGIMRFEDISYRRMEIDWGKGDALPVAADYDGDGATDIAIFSPGKGQWKFLFSGGGFNAAKAMQQVKGFGAKIDAGQKGDIPVVGDFNGDGRSDPALWRDPARLTGYQSKNNVIAETQWLIYFLSKNGKAAPKPEIFNFGLSGIDTPVPADYDCDGKTDAAVYRANQGTWYVRLNAEKTREVHWKVENGIPLAADFDGDGCADPAFYNPHGHFKWEIRNSRFSEALRQAFPNEEPVITRITWGNAEERPVQVVLRKHYFRRH